MCPVLWSCGCSGLEGRCASGRPAVRGPVGHLPGTRAPPCAPAEGVGSGCCRAFRAIALQAGRSGGPWAHAWSSMWSRVCGYTYPPCTDVIGVATAVKTGVPPAGGWPLRASYLLWYWLTGCQIRYGGMGTAWPWVRTLVHSGSLSILTVQGMHATPLSP